MSSGSESDFDETASSGDEDTMLVLAALANQVSVVLPAPPPHADPPPFFGPFQLSGSPTSTIFGIHVCQEYLETFFSVNPDSTANMKRGLPAKALVLHLSCTATNQLRHIERSLNLLLSCAACMRELCMITMVNTRDLTENMLCVSHGPPKLCILASTYILEAVMFRSPSEVPCFYDSMGGPAEFPCIHLGLCHCFMRPLYAAIYFSNGHMLSTLLRYGVEVRPEDTCYCDEPRRMHPLVRVYRWLTGKYYHGRDTSYRRENSSIGINVVRCHQLAALVMPCHNAELPEACYTLVKAFTLPAEFETLLREKGSLRHLCRLTIRAALARRRAMPMGVEQLSLPKLLQQYILYQYGPGCV